jgi:hypothetical protein
MNRIVIAGGLLFAGVLASCTPPRVNPVPTRRFAAYSFTEQRADSPLVRLSVFSIPVPPGDGPRGLLDLAEGGQAEMVKAMADRTESAPSLAQALAIPIAAETPTLPLVDRSTLKRRVVFSVENDSDGPADRVNRARVRVRLPQAGARNPTFVGWNRVESQYQTIDLGKLTSTQSSSTSAELGLTLPVASAAPKFSAGAETSLEEEVTLRQRFASLHGTLTAHEATLMEEGYTGVDLTGNIHADFEIKLPPHDELVYAFNYQVRGGALDCEQRPSLRAFTLRRPDWRGPITAEVELEYVLRHVGSGTTTLIESDDSVTFVRGRHALGVVPLVSAADLEVSVYQLRHPTAGVLAVDDALAGAQMRVRDLQLASYEDAFRLLTWLHRCRANVPGYPILLGGRAARPADVARFQIFNQRVN